MRLEGITETTRGHRLRTSPERQRGVSILVVDDDPVACRATAAVLDDSGYAVEWTTEPAIALERVRRLPYALVISDVQMPALRGTALAAELARVRPETKVVLMSALADARTNAEAAELGVPLLQKPVTLSELLGTVARLTGTERTNGLQP
jgi:DNA-binding NtrC family response regulator